MPVVAEVCPQIQPTVVPGPEQIIVLSTQPETNQHDTTIETIITVNAITSSSPSKGDLPCVGCTAGSCAACPYAEQAKVKWESISSILDPLDSLNKKPQKPMVPMRRVDTPPTEVIKPKTVIPLRRTLESAKAKTNNIETPIDKIVSIESAEPISIETPQYASIPTNPTISAEQPRQPIPAKEVTSAKAPQPTEVVEHQPTPIAPPESPANQSTKSDNIAPLTDTASLAKTSDQVENKAHEQDQSAMKVVLQVAKEQNPLQSAIPKEEQPVKERRKKTAAIQQSIAAPNEPVSFSQKVQPEGTITRVKPPSLISLEDRIPQNAREIASAQNYEHRVIIVPLKPLENRPAVITPDNDTKIKTTDTLRITPDDPHPPFVKPMDLIEFSRSEKHIIEDVKSIEIASSAPLALQSAEVASLPNEIPSNSAIEKKISLSYSNVLHTKDQPSASESVQNSQENQTQQATQPTSAPTEKEFTHSFPLADTKQERTTRTESMHQESTRNAEAKETDEDLIAIVSNPEPPLHRTYDTSVESQQASSESNNSDDPLQDQDVDVVYETYGFNTSVALPPQAEQDQQGNPEQQTLRNAVVVIKEILDKEEQRQAEESCAPAKILRINDRILVAKIYDEPTPEQSNQDIVDKSFELRTTKELVAVLMIAVQEDEKEQELQNEKNAVIIKVTDQLAENIQLIRNTLSDEKEKVIREEDQKEATKEPIILVATNNLIIMPRSEATRMLRAYQKAAEEITDIKDSTIGSPDMIVPLKKTTNPLLFETQNTQAVTTAEMQSYYLETPHQTAEVQPLQTTNDVIKTIETIIDLTSQKHERHTAESEELQVPISDELLSVLDSVYAGLAKKRGSYNEPVGFTYVFSSDHRELKLRLSELTELLEKIRDEQKAVDMLLEKWQRNTSITDTKRSFAYTAFEERTSVTSWLVVSMWRSLLPTT